MGELGGKGMTGNSAGSKKTKQQLTAKDKEATGLIDLVILHIKKSRTKCIA